MSSTPRQAQVYQIDFTAVASGKRIASTKRRVRWRFGFANPDAVSAGQTGTACRGEEHDVTLVWSVTSGKRLVLADGQEVHYSHSRSGVFDFSWTMRGNHVLKIVAHASPPISPTPGFRQYDFFVDGQSFFTFPKLYRLGLHPNDPRASASPTSPTRLAEGGHRRQTNFDPSVRSTGSNDVVALETPTNPDEEEAYLKEAIRQSLQDSTPKASTSGPSGGDLLDLGGSAAPSLPALPPSTSSFPALPPSSSYPPQTTSSVDPFAAPAALAQSSAATDPFGGGPVAAPSSDPWGASVAPPAPAVSAYGYTPQPPAAAPLPALPPSAPVPAAYGAPPPAQGAAPAWGASPAVATQSTAYGGGPEQAVPPSVTPYAQQTPSSLGFASPNPDFTGFSPIPTAKEVPAPAAPSTTTQPSDPALSTMGLLSGQEGLLDANAASGSLVDQAYAKLVNMDTFSLASKNDAPAANPFAASSSTSINDNRSLADMRKFSKPQQPAPAKEIMKSHASNAMVVSSNQNTNYASQYGFQPVAQQQQPAYQQQPPPPPQPSFGQFPAQPQPPAYGQPPLPQYGQPQPQYGYGQPPPQPGYNY